MSIELIVHGESTITRPFNDKTCSRLESTDTPHGSVVAFEHHYGQNTIVPGYLRKETRPEQGKVTRRIEVTPVPEEQQPEVTKILLEHNYLGPFHFW